MKHWMIRVGDGKNFKRSKYPFWACKRGKGGCMKTIVEKINVGDILWFMTNKEHGGIFVGMAEYAGFYDKEDEPLIQINTVSDAEQRWEGDAKWDIQLHYTNMYDTHKQKIVACVQCGGCILEYETFRYKMNVNLPEHYNHYKYYAETTN